MINLPTLTPAEKRFLELLALANPVNENKPTLRLAPQERVNELMDQLNAFKARGTIYFAPDKQFNDAYLEAM